MMLERHLLALCIGTALGAPALAAPLPEASRPAGSRMEASEPAHRTHALLLAGLGVICFIGRRRLGG